MLELLNEQRLQREAATAWVPDYPRRTFTPAGGQMTVRDEDGLIDALEALRGTNSGFVSVYAFPRGHSKDGNIPQVDTLMYDFDIPDGKDIETVAEWEKRMGELLERVRAIATHLVDEGFADYWRGSLSGNKGIHLYQDFPEINPEEADKQQFKNGLSDYTSKLIDHYSDVTGYDVSEWVDVDSSDLGRLTRMPNTEHVGATEFHGETRYCVPVSVRELAEMDVERYVELTSGPRPLPEGGERQENPRAGEIITQHIRDASGSSSGGGFGGSTAAGRSLDDYRDEQNDQIQTLDDVEFILKNKPCIWQFREREDAFRHGDASHTFELFVLVEMIKNRVPVDLMVEYFREMEGFDEGTTRDRIEDVVHWSQGKSFTCETIWNEASQFCLKDDCTIYNEEH